MQISHDLRLARRDLGETLAAIQPLQQGSTCLNTPKTTPQQADSPQR